MSVFARDQSEERLIYEARIKIWEDTAAYRGLLCQSKRYSVLFLGVILPYSKKIMFFGIAS